MKNDTIQELTSNDIEQVSGGCIFPHRTLVDFLIDYFLF